MNGSLELTTHYQGSRKKHHKRIFLWVWRGWAPKVMLGKTGCIFWGKKVYYNQKKRNDIITRSHHTIISHEPLTFLTSWELFSSLCVAMVVSLLHAILFFNLPSFFFSHTEHISILIHFSYPPDTRRRCIPKIEAKKLEAQRASGPLIFGLAEAFRPCFMLSAVYTTVFQRYYPS